MKNFTLTLTIPAQRIVDLFITPAKAGRTIVQIPNSIGKSKMPTRQCSKASP